MAESPVSQSRAAAQAAAGENETAACAGVVDLAQSRAAIDAIDAQIVNLFEERMRVAFDVAAYKRATGKPVLDKEREAAKIAAETALASDEFKQYVPPLFNLLMEMSRSYQERVLGGASLLESAAVRVRRAEAFPSQARVCCQGVAGAYSHIACTHLFANPSVSFAATWGEVCDAVESGAASFGILPLENSTVGTVDRVYDLMAHRGLYIARSLTLRINHDLLAKPGTKIEDVQRIFSHEQALRQCEHYVEALANNVETRAVKNTALAAQSVSESARGGDAAISSSACARLYGLEVLDRSIQDEENNFTRFICVEKEPVYYAGANRSSFVLTIPHEPGSLYRVLARIAALGVNMIKLESRPIPGREFEFMFYVDVEAAPDQEVFMQLVEQLEPLCETCSYLGSYAECSA